jgi:gamma-glutamyltranspeptidase/glutathione hydrolase
MRWLLLACLAVGMPASWAAGSNAAVASAEPHATAAGLTILQQGGNAFDAAVAVSAALAVTEPWSSGLGGGGFWLLHSATGVDVVVDGRETAPRAASARMYQNAQGQAIADMSRYGALAGAIPGEPAALADIAERYGRLTLAADLAPAIALAEQGFPVYPRLVEMLNFAGAHLSPAARQVFFPQNTMPAVGQILRQPDLGWVLRSIAARGHTGFYRGEVAARLVNGVKAAGGIWGPEDFVRYQVVERKPIVTYFRNYRIVSAPPPSAGGIGLAEILQQLEVLGWTGCPRGSCDTATRAFADHQVIEAMRRAYHDRALYLGDPDVVAIPQTYLLSRTHAVSLARSISPNLATPSAQLPQPDRPAREGPDTTHFSVVDGLGNRVAGTLSINLPFGSGFMAPGTGVFVNDEMDDFAASTEASNAYGLIGSVANAIAPGKRPLSSMSPTMVDGPGGTLVLGTPGGSRIVTMVALGILHFIEGADVSAIVSAPRYHQQYLPDVVEFETGAFPGDEAVRLAQMGYVLKPVGRAYGNMQAIIDAANGMTAASDPRGVGAASVIAQPAAIMVPATPASVTRPPAP